jgi:hypothetical protein
MFKDRKYGIQVITYKAKKFLGITYGRTLHKIEYADFESMWVMFWRDTSCWLDECKLDTHELVAQWVDNRVDTKGVGWWNEVDTNACVTL